MDITNIQEHRNCVLCELDDTRVVYDFPAKYYDRNKFTTFSWDGELDIGLRIVQCKCCGLIYQNPCITPAAMKYVYPESIIPDKIDFEHLLATHKFGLILDLVKKFQPKSEGIKPNAIDIGTRYGVLPMLLNMQGINAHGIEYNQKCVTAAQISGCECIHQGDIQGLKSLAAKMKIERFHIMTMIDVIEHLIHPLDEIKMLSELQKSGDLMIVTTMDTNALGHKIFGKYWYYIHSQHTFYFTKETLIKLFDRLGYRLEQTIGIPAYKALPQIPAEVKKLRRHLHLRNNPTSAGKEWFAKNRPHLFDLFTLVFRKN